MPAAGDPVLASDIANLAAYTTGEPVGRLVQAATQNIASGTTAVLLTFGAGSEDIDTHNYHDTSTNTDRVLPLIAGYYWVTAGLCIGGRTDFSTIEVSVTKNGVGMAPALRVNPGTNAQTQVFSTGTIVTCNGSSDYFGGMARQANTAAATVATAISVQFASTLTWFLLRPL